MQCKKSVRGDQTDQISDRRKVPVRNNLQQGGGKRKKWPSEGKTTLVASINRQPCSPNNLAFFWGCGRRGNCSVSLRNKTNQSNKPADLSKGYNFAINKWKKNSINWRLPPCLRRNLLLYHSIFLLPSMLTEECFSWYLSYLQNPWGHLGARGHFILIPGSLNSLIWFSRN